MPKLYITDQDQYAMLDWSAKRCGLQDKWPDETFALGVKEEGSDTLRAVVLYNAFYDGECHIHIASDHTRRWATPKTLAALLGYPFIMRNVTRINANIPEDNQRSLIMCLKVGFKFEGIKRAGAAGGSNVILLGMLAQECRWIKTKQEA